MKRPRILVVGSINMDIAFCVSRLPEEGETVISTKFYQIPGGKGANQAVAAAKLGGEVIFLGKIGQDSLGDQLVKHLQMAGVDTTFVLRDPLLPSGIAGIILNEKGGNRIIVVPGANGALTKYEVEEVWRNAGRFDVVVAQLEVPLEVVRRVGTMAKEQGAIFILNPAPAMILPDELIACATILIPNETEAGLLTGLKVMDYASAEAAALELKKRGAEKVVVTLGDRGVLVLAGTDCRVFPAYNVEVIDTVGAGDAFTGALAVMLGEGREWSNAICFANAAAALAVTKRGAQDAMPTRVEVESFLRLIGHSRGS